MLNACVKQTQMIATVFHGITLHNPKGLWSRRHAQRGGYTSAMQWRDSGQPIPEGDEARSLVAASASKLQAQPLSY
jgi:enoyl-CoA hydratase